MYRETDTAVVIRVADGALIPDDTGNADRQVYLQWLNDGNTPLPASAPTWRAVIWAEYRTLRDVYLSRLEGIAGRAYRAGDAAFAAAIDVFVQGTLDIPQDPTTQAGVTPTRDDLQAAINARFSALKNTAVGYDPTTATTAYPDRRIAIDKVFK